MKQVIRTIALFVVLSMVATACQKEQISSPYVVQSDSYGVTSFHYSVNGTSCTVSVQDDEIEAFFLRMTALARQYGNVSVFNESSYARTNVSKEVLTFTTIKESEASDWAKARTREGYEVTISYDSKTGVYTCIAIR